MSSQKTRIIKCGHCHLPGHNRRTCSMPVCLRRKVKKIKKIKKGAYTKKSMVETCSICMEDCKGKTCTLECGHKFHTKCIFTWFKKNNNCPLCRAVVPELKKKVEHRVTYISRPVHVSDGTGVHLPHPRLIRQCVDMINDYIEDFGSLPNEIQRENMTNSDLVISVMTVVAGVLQESDSLDTDLVEVDEWWNRV